MDKTDVIINAIKKVKKNIKDKIKIKLDEDYIFDEKEIKKIIGNNVKIKIEKIKHKKDDKIKLLTMEINNEKIKQFPNKEFIKELEDKIKKL